MESKLERLEKAQHNVCEDLEECHYSEPSNQLKEVLKKVHNSAIVRAQAAHEADVAHQKHNIYKTN